MSVDSSVRSRRRAWLRAVARAGLAVPLAAAAAASTARAATPAAQNAAQLWQPREVGTLRARMRTERRVLVGLFSRPDCVFCAALRRDQLVHLVRESDHLGIIVAEFDLTMKTRFGGADASSPFGDSPAEFARRMNVRATPTLVFMGEDGEVAERLVGYGSPDFYGAYLDDRIETAKRAVIDRKVQR